MDDESGSIGGLAGFVILFLGWGLFLVIYGGIFDKLIISANSYFLQTANAGLPVVQDQYDTMNYIVLFFKSLPFIFILTAGIRHWLISLRESPGGYA